jgi:hypothetical protein
MLLRPPYYRDGPLQCGRLNPSAGGELGAQLPVEQYSAQMMRMENTCGGLQRKHVGGNGSITIPSRAIEVAVHVSLTLPTGFSLSAAVEDDIQRYAVFDDAAQILKDTAVVNCSIAGMTHAYHTAYDTWLFQLGPIELRWITLVLRSGMIPKTRQERPSHALWSRTECRILRSSKMSRLLHEGFLRWSAC